MKPHSLITVLGEQASVSMIALKIETWIGSLAMCLTDESRFSPGPADSAMPFRVAEELRTAARRSPSGSG